MIFMNNLKISLLWKYIKIEFSVKKALLIVFLIFIAVFVLKKVDSFTITTSYFNNERVTSISKADKIKYKESPELLDTIKDDMYRY